MISEKALYSVARGVPVERVIVAYARCAFGKDDITVFPPVIDYLGRAPAKKCLAGARRITGRDAGSPEATGLQ